MTIDPILDSLYEKLTTAAIGGDPEAYAAVFVDNGSLLPPGAPPVVGRQNIRAWIEHFLNSFTLEVDKFEIDESAIGDRVAFCRWTSSGTYVHRDGERFPYDQKYLDTIVKDADGEWRFAVHMWSPNQLDWGAWSDL